MIRRCVVVIPTYNESANIAHVVERVRAALPTADVLVVDDNSPDGTQAIVAGLPGFAVGEAPEGGRVFLLARPGKAGLGAAYRAGFGWALERGYDAIVQMDADLSHPPEKLPELIGALDRADVAVGSRYVPGGRTEDWPASRRFISGAGNTYVRLVLNLPARDATAGFKAWRADALRTIEVLDSASNGYGFQVENTWRAAREGLRITEVPITFTDRTAGTSKMSLRIVLEALLRVLVWRLRSSEVLTFLAVGGTAYVVDVAAFNLLRDSGPFARLDPAFARTVAVIAAMCVTYVGNRFLTWGTRKPAGVSRELVLFTLVNVIGFGLSLACLLVSHDVMGLTSRLDDNVSANVVGLLLGTLFRFFAYKYVVFAEPASEKADAEQPVSAG